MGSGKADVLLSGLFWLFPCYRLVCTWWFSFQISGLDNIQQLSDSLIHAHVARWFINLFSSENIQTITSEVIKGRTVVMDAFGWLDFVLVRNLSFTPSVEKWIFPPGFLLFQGKASSLGFSVTWYPSWVVFPHHYPPIPTIRKAGWRSQLPVIRISAVSLFWVRSECWAKFSYPISDLNAVEV